MGCASSNPLVEGGKNLVTTAKESVNDVVSKGEHTLHEAADGAKEGMEHVKEAVESAMTTVEHSIGNVVGKVSNTLNSTKNNALENVDGAKEKVEEVANKITEGTTEVVSEAETVVVSEAENAREAFAAKTFKKIDSFTDEFGETVNQTKEEIADAMHIEDIEQSIDTIDTNVKDMKKKAEDLVNGLSTPSPTPPETEKEAEKEEKKEEPPPTFWEAAADAILRQVARPSLDIADASQAGDAVSTGSGNASEDLFTRDRALPPPEIIIHSETLSVNSYKSET